MIRDMTGFYFTGLCVFPMVPGEEQQVGVDLPNGDTIGVSLTLGKSGDPSTKYFGVELSLPLNIHKTCISLKRLIEYCIKRNFFMSLLKATIFTVNRQGAPRYPFFLPILGKVSKS